MGLKKYILKLKNDKGDKAKILNVNQIFNEFDFFFLLKKKLPK